MPSDPPNVDGSNLELRLRELLALMQKDDPTEAIYACDSFNRDYPMSGQGWSIASQLALRINDARAAIRAIDHALEIEPNRTEWRLQKANCLPLVGRMADARLLAAEMSKQLYPSGHLSSAVGLLLARLNMHDEARPLFEEAVRLEPDVGGHYYNLATVQRFLGDLDKAETNLNKAIELEPGDVEAIALRSGLRTQTSDRNHVAELKQMLEAGSEMPRKSVSICYAVAKELEDLGEHAESFRYLRQGADLRRKHISYDVAVDLDTMDAIRKTFDEAWVEDCGEGHIDASPIFVIGMPRTGTTLVERILGSHSVVRAAGELNNFALALTNVAKATATSPVRSRADLIEASGHLDVAKLGQAYVDSCRDLREGHAHFVDKMPMNFLYAGLIHRALPKARIIHVVRDPMDTCYAVLKTLFEGAYPYSYELEELGEYFVSYRRLMDHWERLIPGVMMHIRYEDLVTDTKVQIQNLLAFCGLSWEDQCLEFHEQAGASTTASAAQVRKPVYRSSIGNWKNCREQLQPVANILERAGILSPR